MEQFLTGDIWEEVNKLFVKKQSKIACISYVTTVKLHLSKGDILICDASDYEIKFGTTSAKVLDSYFKKGVVLYSNQNLHTKFLLTNSFLVIGSANLSKRSSETLIESAVVTEDDILLSQGKSFCHNIMEEKATVALTRKHIDRLLKIEVVKRAYKPGTKSKIRTKKFGSRYWYISLGNLTDRAYNKVKHKIESSIIKVTEDTDFTEEEINSIYFKNKTVFSTQAKEGDQVMLNWQNETKTRRFIFPFATILRIDRKKNETIFIYDDTASGEKYSLAKFISLIKNLELDKQLDKPRSKEISTNDSKKLKALW